MPSAIAVCCSSSASRRAQPAAAPSMPVRAGDVPAAVVVVGVHGVADAAATRRCRAPARRSARGRWRRVCSASASTAEATGPAGWMMVLRCVSSKSKVCELMPLISAALAMSTRSRAAQHVACGAGCSICTAASAASAASWCAAPTAQPTQLRKVRWASWSTASLQPRDGMARRRSCASDARDGRRVVVGGDLGVAGHGRSFGRSGAQLSSWMLRALASCGPARDVGADELGRTAPGVIGIGSTASTGQLLAQVGRREHRVQRVVELLDHGGRHAGRADHAVPLHARRSP